MKLIQSLFFLSFSLFLFISFVQLEAQTIYVNSSATGGNDGSSWTNAYSNLNVALEAATTGADIWLAAGTYYPEAVNATGFNLKNGVSIYGGFNGSETALVDRDWENNESILSGDLNNDDIELNWTSNKNDNTYHVIIAGAEIDASTVLDGIRIIGGHASAFEEENGRGGGILMSGSPVIRNCEFRNNFSQQGGGVIMVLEGAVLSLDNCNFSFNRSNGQGACVYNIGSENGSINNCVFSVGSAFRGGGIDWLNSPLELTNSEFSYNFSDGWGGGLTVAQGATLSMDNCLFNSNSSNGGGGGGLYMEAASASRIANCTFSENETSGFSGGAANFFNSPVDSILNCSFLANMGTFGGAAIFYGIGATYNSYMNGCEFLNNNAVSWGGAIQLEDGIGMSLNNSSFEINQSIGGGGGALNLFEAGNVEINVCEFLQNVSSASGAAVYSFNTQLESIYGSNFEGNNASGWGGAVIINNPDVAVNSHWEGNTFSFNIANNYGGCIQLQYQTRLTLDSCAFLLNATNTGNGAAINSFEADSLKLINSIFQENTSNGSGGAINALNTDYFYAEDCLIQSNRSETGWGGAIRINADTLLRTSVMNNCYVAGNIAENWGGALQITGNQNFEASDCIFENNTANTGNAGAINLIDLLEARFDSCEFIGNSSTTSFAGALTALNYIDTIMELKIDNSLFRENSAFSGAGTILTRYAETTIRNSIFENNICQGDGLLYAWASEWEINNCRMSGNDIASGEALIVERDTLPLSVPKVDVINSTIYESAGIFLIDDGEVNLTNSILWEPVDLLVLETGTGSINGQYSLLSTFLTGEGMLANALPYFEEESEGDFRLTSESQAINAGIADTNGLSLPTVDLLGNPRITDDRIDIGAYEYAYHDTAEVPEDTMMSALLFPFLENKVQVYPNPTSEKVNFKLAENTPLPVHFELFNIQGEIILSQQLLQREEQIALQNIPTGAYLYSLHSKDLNGKEILIKKGRLIVE